MTDTQRVTNPRNTSSTLPPDAQAAFSELATITLSNHTFHEVVQKISELARSVVPGADEVSVTLLDGEQPKTVAYTGELALQLDEQQYARGVGPCLQGAATGTTVDVDDMSTEDRWPEWAEVARDAGAGSLLTVPVLVQREVSAGLNMYSRKRHGFDDQSRTLATTFATYARVALANAHLYEAQARVAQQLQEAMKSRAVIDQARGILMAQRRCDADEAFNMLVELSQRTNKKLRVIAQAIVDQATKPG